MSINRRTFISLTGATVTMIPFMARSAGHSGDVFDTDGGPITIHPVDHASFVMETRLGAIYVDPVGDAAAYADLPPAALILVTHEHGDHYNADLLATLASGDTPPRIIANPAVYDMMPVALKGLTTVLANGDRDVQGDMTIDAIPAYNTTESRLNFHPKGRDNGYVVELDGFRTYISADTEDTPEMRALEDIDLAFVCMNLPFTMDAEAAASAVTEFGPRFVYPYHYRGRDNGTQDPMEFANILGDGIEAKMGAWYG